MNQNLRVVGADPDNNNIILKDVEDYLIDESIKLKQNNNLG